MDWLFPFPENVSTFGQSVDQMFWAITIITGVVFVLVEVLLILFVLRYRQRAGRTAEHIHGNHRLELTWTLGVGVIVAALGVWSWPLWLSVKEPGRFPAADLELVVAAKQFEWNVTYPGADGRLGTTDDFTKRNQLHVPVNKKVHIRLESDDVIHSFYLPNFRLKQDAVPGMRIPAWFEAQRTGQYQIACAELCGLGHYRMKASMTVHSEEDYVRWQQEQINVASAASGINVEPTTRNGGGPSGSLHAGSH